MQTKLGFQSPKNKRVKQFNYVHIKGDLHYCESHNFMYNSDEQEELLYNGKPCYYTDGRYYDGDYNYFHSTYLHFSRYRWGSKFGISLKSAFRLVEQCGNIPVGTIIDFEQDWSINGVNPSYKYKVRKLNKFDPEYKVSSPSFSANFKRDEKSKNLVDALRENGFLVRVWDENPSFIGSMMKSATKLVGQPYDEDIDQGGEIAVAYGFGKKIGFSSHSDSFMGYTNGEENILYDYFGEFNKWSQCHEITKKTKLKEIIKRLRE